MITGLELGALAWEETRKALSDVWDKLTPEEKAEAAGLAVLYVQVEIERFQGKDVAETEGLIKDASKNYADVGAERIKDALTCAAMNIIKIAAGKVLSFA